MTETAALTAEERARFSLGSSTDAVYRMVARALADIGHVGGDLLDVGCGSGQLWESLRDRFDRYTGADIVAYDGFPPEGRFIAIDMDTGTIPTPDGSFDVVAAVETIEHVDGPRRFVRELARQVKPGGWLVVTTPNQLSIHSLMSLLLRGYFGAFAEAPGLYPAHITALVETDLLRIVREAGLVDARIRYSNRGRVTLTPWHWPPPFRGRRFSDNILVAARRPLDL
ncbi:MAG: methyltransferase domain-containing protein [Isosphaeraceae bacterium]